MKVVQVEGGVPGVEHAEGVREHRLSAHQSDIALLSALLQTCETACY